ncbi:MAG: tetratricopeptide repeat protein [Planctomycetaceae bacterium]
MPPNHPDELDADAAAENAARAAASRKKLSLLLLGVGLLGTMLITAGTYFLLKPEDDAEDPAELLEVAFQALEEGRFAQAKELSAELQKKDYRHYPGFSGAPEYILGMIAFRQAIDPSNDEVGREQKYLEARNHLLDADRYIIDTARRPEWAYALGKSLYYTGSAATAGLRLKDALDGGCQEKADASFTLVDIWLNSRDQTDLKNALQINLDLLKTSDLSTADLDRAYLQQVQLFLSLGRNQEAEAALDKLSEDSASNQATILFHAQTRMAENKFPEAIAQLELVAQDLSASASFARQASYLLGVCREKLGDKINAIDDYQRTTDRYGGSPEALAATLRAASLLRQIPSNEKALAAYLAVLSSISPEEDYQNRWLSKEELQDEIIQTWEDWVAKEAFAEAIALSQAMSSVFKDVMAIEYTTLAHQKWAEHLQAEYDDATPQEREILAPELRERWSLSGQQFEKLSEAWKTTPRYTEAIRLSAEHFRMGHEYELSLKQWQKFIDVEPAVGMPNAYVQRGEVLMDLDHLDEALENFGLVIERYSTDAARFTAEYLSGQCFLEKDELKKAEQIWRSIITKGNLGPGAREWRLSLFSLGKYLSNMSDLLRWRAMKGTTEAADPASQALLEESYQRAEEAIRRLEEYVKRYGKSNEITQARFLLAHSLQHVADQHRRKFAVAETENARQEQLKAMQDQLRQAVGEYTELKDQLIRREADKKIETLEKFMLKECFFEIAHTRYGLEEYEEAIGEYTKAANRYPHDARAILAYLQMTRCYDKLGKPTEARSKLEQVKYILEGLPDESFQPHLTNLSKEEWQSWVQWAIRLYQQEQPDANRPLPTTEPAS